MKGNHESIGSIKLSDLVDMEDHFAVIDTIEAIVQDMLPGSDFEPVRSWFFTVRQVYHGELFGYRACNTGYHDFKHTLDVLLATVRLAYGTHAGYQKLSERDIVLLLIAALFHDIGYIQSEDDAGGTGAKYTKNHVQRGIEFANSHLWSKGSWTGHDKQTFDACLYCTDIAVDFSRIGFPDERAKLLGRILGSADLIGQMADRTYLEKLLFLYYEMEEAKLGEFAGEFDLLQRSIDFYHFVNRRLEVEMADVKRFMIFYFKRYHQIDRDIYEGQIHNNIQYLKKIIREFPNNYRQQLRRSGLMSKLLAMYPQANGVAP